MAGDEYTRGGGLVVKKYLEIQKGVNNLRFNLLLNPTVYVFDP